MRAARRRLLLAAVASLCVCAWVVPVAAQKGTEDLKRKAKDLLKQLENRGANPQARPALEAVQIASLADNRVRESSGLVASLRNPGVLWTHNDSGDDAYVYATDMSGRALARFLVTGAKNVDWEDIAIGPGPGDQPALYIADLGDNDRKRTDICIYRVTEPEVDRAKTRVEGETMLAQRFPVRYPDGKHDAEALVVHPTTGEILIITKEDSGRSGVYTYPLPLRRDTVVTLERVRTFEFVNPLIVRGYPVGKLATAADVSHDGRFMVVRSYTDAFEWTVPPGQKLADAVKSTPRALPVPWLGQFEAICYTPDAKFLLTTCEGAPCPLWRVPR